MNRTVATTGLPRHITRRGDRRHLGPRIWSAVAEAAKRPATPLWISIRAISHRPNPQRFQIHTVQIHLPRPDSVALSSRPFEVRPSGCRCLRIPPFSPLFADVASCSWTRRPRHVNLLGASPEIPSFFLRFAQCTDIQSGVADRFAVSAAALQIAPALYRRRCS